MLKLELINGISNKRSKLLERLNIFSIQDLVSFFPKKYKDLTNFVSIAKSFFFQDETVVKAKVVDIETIVSKTRKNITKIKIQDETGVAYLVSFNPYIKNTITVGKEYVIIGVFVYQYNRIESSQFIIEDVNQDSLNYGRIVPFYSLTEGITQKMLRKWIYEGLQIFEKENGFRENLPPEIIEKRFLINRKDAFYNIHFPSSFDLLNRAIYRFKYTETLKLEFNMVMNKSIVVRKKPRLYTDKGLVAKVIESLPFKLTNAQKNAFYEIKKDMDSLFSMHRLLQGDVGSGKTVVALLAMVYAFENSYQSVIMVPTDVLAKQHYERIKNIVSPFGIKVGLFTGSLSPSERGLVLKLIESSDLNIIVGTHALFSDDVKYKNLGLIVIDEQHKFGVIQRAKLINKGDNPDILVMTATPIPRTLGLTYFGDMDISIIDEKPNRKKIITEWYKESKIEKVFNKVRDEIKKGNQGYIIYPLIEDSEKLDLKSVTTMFDHLQNEVFKEFRLVLLHGRMSEDEKEDSVRRLINKEADILVSTTVIEVGIDIPSATFIVIENAHRFGLSTLHQLRGRVGRNNIQSYCFLVTPDKITEDAIFRMKVMVETDDGFKIAEEDLKIRGVGEFLGIRQKGFDGLKLTSLLHDTKIIKEAREDAFMLVSRPDIFKSSVVKKWYNEFMEKNKDIIRT